ncbi:MAG TPA: lytic transglycosylase domain-containing protein [Candidatus Limnocylindria bacterium]|nr:lytic transglycosylase domain-containing protein [Candidatus Limnocylindria bacterium]
MHLRPALLFAAALTIAAPVLSAAPAGAQVTGSEATYAAVLRSINPKLPADKARAYARSVMADAWRTHLDPRFIMSIVTVESAWRANAVSRVGARGLGQLMPGTAHTLGVNPWSPYENLRGTSNYLKSLLNHFAGRPNAVTLAIAGYNAGPKAVERYHGIPPYAETQNYVVRVLHVWNELNAKVGRAFAPKVDVIPVAAMQTPPDEREWMSNVNDVLPTLPVALPEGTTPIGASADATTPTTPNAPVTGTQTTTQPQMTTQPPSAQTPATGPSR